MKQLLRRFSRVADSSSQYSLLRRDSAVSGNSSRRRSLALAGRSFRSSKSVPGGHVPVYVGDGMERFVVSAELLNHPVFVELLNKSAQEYGYKQEGVLRIPCHVLVFERIMEAIRLGSRSRDLEGLVGDVDDYADVDDYF